MGDNGDIRETRAGRFVPQQSGAEAFSAFHPRPLPPVPPLRTEADVQARIDAANQALGRLDGVTLLLPDPDLFIYVYVRKEAVLSSQIEGTQSSLSDLLLFEHQAAPGVPIGDVEATSNYIAAANHGLHEIGAGRPISLRLIRELHRLLVQGTRGSLRDAGEFRRVQNWLGGNSPAMARFVPPPPLEVIGAMSALEKFIHDDPVKTPTLLKAALSHAQFETIHPFLDGNGRVGRLLITLLLCAEPPPPERRVLTRPLLYLSLYLKRNRDAYYDSLQRIRTDGEWEEWVAFFLDGVIEVSSQATTATQRIVQMIEADRQRLHTLGRAAGSAQQVHALLGRKVVTSIPEATRDLPLTEPTVATGLGHLERLGIAREITGRKRGRLFAYDEYLGILNEGTERE
jgi:Fic family protein